MMPPGPHVCPRCLWAVHRNQLHMFAHVCAHAKTPEHMLLCQHGNKAARISQRDERSVPAPPRFPSISHSSVYWSDTWEHWHLPLWSPFFFLLSQGAMLSSTLYCFGSRLIKLRIIFKFYYIKETEKISANIHFCLILISAWCWIGPSPDFKKHFSRLQYHDAVSVDGSQQLHR